MAAQHTATVEMDEDGVPWLITLACLGGPSDQCHQWCAEGCEETCYGDGIILTGADVEPIAQAPLKGHRWEPMPPDGRACRVIDWLDAVGARDTYIGEDTAGEPLRAGTHLIEEDWDGDCYLWQYAETTPVVSDAGVPL